MKFEEQLKKELETAESLVTQDHLDEASRLAVGLAWTFALGPIAGFIGAQFAKGKIRTVADALESLVDRRDNLVKKIVRKGEQSDDVSRMIKSINRIDERIQKKAERLDKAIGADRHAGLFRSSVPDAKKRELRKMIDNVSSGKKMPSNLPERTVKEFNKIVGANKR